jgi:glycerol-3-phosphate dehydrogenase
MFSLCEFWQKPNCKDDMNASRQRTSPKMTIDIEDLCAEKCKTPLSDCISDHNSGYDFDDTILHDIIIVGGGAIGCSIARELSKYQLDVLLLEKSSDVSQGASKSNSGIVHGGYDEKHGTLKAMLAHKGNQMFSQLNEELNFGFRRIGSLVLAFNDSDMLALNTLLANGKLNGVKNLRIINREEVLKLEPHVNPDVVAALLCLHTGITSPYEYTIALAENAVQNGVTIALNHEVMDIVIVANDTINYKSGTNHKTHFLIRTVQRDRVFRAKIVINAAGLMADRVAAMVGANDFTITPRKGEYIILNKSQGRLANHVLFPVPNSIRGKGILVSPTFHGNLLLGPTSRGAGEGRLTQRDIIRLILSSARQSIPNFDPATAITSYTGLRAKCSKGDFIVQESNVVQGFVNTAGIDSPGLTSSPAVAKLVLEILTRPLKKLYNVDLLFKPNFNPYRKPIIIPKDHGFIGAIDHPDPQKNIICRCERVT